MPQLLKNVRFGPGVAPLESEKVQAVIRDAEARLTGKGRLLIRKSGTEPLIRVMAEGQDAGQIERVVTQLAAIVKEQTGEPG